MPHQWVYHSHGAQEAEAYTGSWDGVRGLLGGKGARKAELARIGVPVLPGFTVTTEACAAYLAAGEQLPEDLWEQAVAALKSTEETTGKTFGDTANPLLLCCSSSARFSTPGIMSSILDVGLNDETAKGMVAPTGDERYVYNLYRRLVQVFGLVVLDIPDEEFEQAVVARRKERGAVEEGDLIAEDWKALTEEFKAILAKHHGIGFPQDPFEQLRMVIEAGFRSWNSTRTCAYREREQISHGLGVAISAEAWVFGNVGWDSGVGVVFTRNPVSGENVLYGEYCTNASGDDRGHNLRRAKSIAELEKELPKAHAQLVNACAVLETHYRDMQDVEFRIEEGRLWISGAVNGTRSAQAAFKIAVDMAHEGLITREEALLRVKPEQLDVCLLPLLAATAKAQAHQQGAFLVRGMPASPGAAVGMAVFDTDRADEWGQAGKDVILVRPRSNPGDSWGLIQAKGILLVWGLSTGSAAVIARRFGKPAVVNCEALEIDPDSRRMEVDGKVVKEGDWLSIDGTSGEVFRGKIATEPPRLEELVELKTLLAWAETLTGLR